MQRVYLCSKVVYSAVSLGSLRSRSKISPWGKFRPGGMHAFVFVDKLQGQMAVAENLRIPYTIIMGQKEAMEDSVIVRDMPTRNQNTVKIDELAKYIEKLK